MFVLQVFVVSVNSVYIPAAVCTVTSPGYYVSTDISLVVLKRHKLGFFV